MWLSADQAAPAAASAPAEAGIRQHPYRALGSFRFLLAWLVLTSHASTFLSDEVTSLSLGNVGVFLFFVVSGFVIFEALDVFYRESPTRFMGNRCLKIFPAYWAAVIFCYVVYGSLGQEDLRFDALALLVNATMLLSYLPKGNGLLIISIAWAVVVEFQFYILAALSFALALRTRAPGAALAWIGVIVLAAAAFVHLTQGFTRFYGAFQFGPYFVLGASLYYFVSRRDRRLIPLMAVSFLFSLYAFVSYNARGDLAGVVWALTASALLYVSGCLLMARLVGARLQAPVEWLDKRLGDVTYAIYLVHTAVIAVMIAAGLDGGLAYLASFAGSIAVAVAIHRAVERPVMKIRNVLRGCRLYD